MTYCEAPFVSKIKKRRWIATFSPRGQIWSAEKPKIVCAKLAYLDTTRARICVARWYISRVFIVNDNKPKYFKKHAALLHLYTLWHALLFGFFSKCLNLLMRFTVTRFQRKEIKKKCTHHFNRSVRLPMSQVFGTHVMF